MAIEKKKYPKTNPLDKVMPQSEGESIPVVMSVDDIPKEIVPVPAPKPHLFKKGEDTRRGPGLRKGGKRTGPKKKIVKTAVEKAGKRLLNKANRAKTPEEMKAVIGSGIQNMIVDAVDTIRGDKGIKNKDATVAIAVSQWALEHFIPKAPPPPPAAVPQLGTGSPMGTMINIYSAKDAPLPVIEATTFETVKPEGNEQTN